jgi:hypothetical protein
VRGETPEIIEPHDVIGMCMGIQHRINFLYTRPQRLNSEFGAGIDNPGTIFRFHVN